MNKKQKMVKPNEVVIELTSRCNIECDFCFNDDLNNNNNNNAEILKKDVFKILEDISRSGINAVRFTGGEPFL